MHLLLLQVKRGLDSFFLFDISWFTGFTIWGMELLVNLGHGALRQFGSWSSWQRYCNTGSGTAMQALTAQLRKSCSKLYV